MPMERELPWRSLDGVTDPGNRETRGSWETAPAGSLGPYSGLLRAILLAEYRPHELRHGSGCRGPGDGLAQAPVRRAV
jgi:hypothetical protein